MVFDRSGGVIGNNWRLFFLIFLASSLALGAPGLAEADPLVRIMPLGDSITQGGYTAGYRPELASLLKAAGYSTEFVGSQQNGLPDFADRGHEGHPGFLIGDVSAQAATWVEAAKPDVVLLLIGTNDALRSPDPKHSLDRLATLVAKIERSAPHAHVLVSSVIPNADPAVQAPATPSDDDDAKDSDGSKKTHEEFGGGLELGSIGIDDADGLDLRGCLRGVWGGAAGACGDVSADFLDGGECFFKRLRGGRVD